jgi:competence protein ComGF
MAFTLFEMILSLVIVVSMAVAVKKLINLAAENAKSSEEIRSVDRELELLLAKIKADLEMIVLFDRGNPIFEICKKNDENGFKIFFLTTNHDRNVTAAVKYDITELEFGEIEITRTVLSAKGTLMLQNSTAARASFEKIFENIDPGQKFVHKYGITLSDFRIRMAVRTRDGSVILSHPSSKTLYSAGTLAFERGNQNFTFVGNLSFFDVSAKALCKSDAIKFRNMKSRKIEIAKEFMSSHSRRNFARIVPISENF